MLNIALVKSDKSKQMFAIGIIFSKKALKLMTTSALNTLDSPAHQFVDEKFYVNNSKKKAWVCGDTINCSCTKILHLLILNCLLVKKELVIVPQCPFLPDKVPSDLFYFQKLGEA